VVRRDIIYTGNVQGVGFRYSTHSIAASYQVVGCVRNQPDGQVQVQVEGTLAELDRFQAEIADRLSSHIRSTHTETRPATGEFTNFEIRG
jgi:acylphosphatase